MGLFTAKFSKTDVRYWNAVVTDWQQYENERLWRLHSDKVNTALLARWLPPGQISSLLKTDLFDEAVSDGLYPFLASRAKKVASIDLSPILVQTVHTRYPDLLATCADVRQLPFAEGAFEVIVSNSTLDHFAVLDDLIASIRELHRVLCPGGQLLLTLDNPANPMIAIRNALPFRLLKLMGLVAYYNGATCHLRHLEWHLVRQGFEVQDVGTLEHCPRVVAVALARFLERYTGQRAQNCFLRCLMACERLGRLPGRIVTGHYFAVRAVKR